MIKQRTYETIGFSNKITLIQFILSVAIVYQHTQWRYSGGIIFINKIHEFLFYLFEAAVPMFFMISGYLFYRTFSIEKTKEKLKSRVKTLLVPYLIWNVVYAVFFVTMSLIGFVKNIHIEWNGKIVLQILNSDFSPLWFVKYLMIFTLIAPIMYYVFKNKYFGAIAILGMISLNVLAYVFGIIKAPLDVNENSIVMLNYQYIFYAIGAWAGLNCRDWVENPTKSKRIISLVAVCVLCAVYFTPIFKIDVIVSHTFRIFFAIAVWFVFDWVPEIKMNSWLKMSFWIYCTHTIVIQCIQRVISIVLSDFIGATNLLWVAEWFILPIVVVIALIFIGIYMQKYLSKVYNVVTGNRT